MKPIRFTTAQQSEGWGKLSWYVVLDNERPVYAGVPREVARCLTHADAANVCSALNAYHREVTEALDGLRR